MSNNIVSDVQIILFSFVFLHFEKENLSNCEKSGGARRRTIVHGRADRILRALARFLKMIKVDGPEQIIDEKKGSA